MPEKDFLSKLLSENLTPPKLSSSDQIAALLNVPKQPSFSDQLVGLKNLQSSKPIFDEKEQHKEHAKEEPRNPKYIVTNKNFSRLIDKADEHDSKIEMMYLRLTDMEDSQTSMQAEIAKINKSLKESKNIPVQKLHGIDWKSFAYGAIVLACLWFAIHRLT